MTQQIFTSRTNMWLIRTVLATGLLVALTGRSAAARDLWVDKASLGGACNDSRLASAVTKSTPWCTLARAVSQVVAGDNVYVRAATYTEGLQPSRAGTTSQWIRFAAEPGEIVNLQAAGVRVLGSFNEVSGFRITAVSGNCVYVNGVPDVRLTNLEVFGCGSGAVELHNAQRVTLEGSRIHDNTQLNFTSAIDLYLCRDGNVIRGNWVWANGDTGADNGEGHGLIMDTCLAAGGALIENNVIGGNEGWGIVIYSSDNATIRNNTLYLNSSRSGCEIRVKGNNGVVHNNIMVARSCGLQNDGANTVQGFNLTSATPGFVNAAAGDFHLTATSVARDTGDNSHAASIDFDRVTRPQGATVDKGAYEYVTSTTPTAPAAPTGVTATPTQLTWNESSVSSVNGFAVTLDSSRIDYMLTPLGPAGSCGCSIPLPFSGGGRHTILVSAYNSVGETFSAPLTVGPTANAGGPYAGQAGVSIGVNGSLSNHPAGTIISYEWTWGDGAVSSATSSPTASHSYANTGSFTITLKVTDNGGATATATTTASITTNAPPTALFVRTDTTTRGSWVGVYGRDGYTVVNDATSYPSYVQVTPSGPSPYTWLASTTDVRALQRASGTGRIASAWYGATSFTINLNFANGTARQLALYLLDWDTSARGERIEILNAATGAILDTRTVTGFNAGQYLVYTVSGNVTVRVTRTGGVNAVVSGLFFDTAGPTNTPPTVNLTAPAGAASYPAPATVNLAATASDSDGISRVDFYAGSTIVGTDATFPYQATWVATVGGVYAVTARATDNLGATTTSSPVNVTITTSAPPGASAAFVRTDTTTQGNWIGVYGHDGYATVNDATSYPGYAQVTLGGTSAWTWQASTTDARALQRASGAGRIAATWHNSSSFTIDLNLAAGATHQVALYSVDWDSTSRGLRVDVLDAVTGTVLDTRTLSGFNGGKYLVWTVSGHVTVRVTRTAGANGVASGFFFD